MKGYLWSSGLAMLAILFSGCAAREKPLAASPTFRVETAPTAPVSVQAGMVRRTEDGLVVAGTVRRPHEVHLAGHIDVAVIGPGGELIGRKQGAVPGLHSKRKGLMDVAFKIRLDFLPPAESIVHLRYHAPPFGEEPSDMDRTKKE